MFSQAKTTQQLFYIHVRHIHGLKINKTASSLAIGNVQNWRQMSRLRNLLAIGHNHIKVDSDLRVLSSYSLTSNKCRFSANATDRHANEYDLSEDACPQGIQGDDCSTFRLWLDNCRRYGLPNCNEQLQGIQSGRKTLSEVLAEQDLLIANIAAQYRVVSHRPSHSSSHQGVQEYTAAVDEYLCLQGVQGYDCANFKLWLENCKKSGLSDCTQKFDSFKDGRKSLSEIFAEQYKCITEASTPSFQSAARNRREYSTSTKSNEVKNDDKPEGSKDVEGQLTQRQKLKRAVKEYGSTVIVFHVTISLMSLGFFYLLVSSGIDIVGLLMKYNIGGSLLQNKLAAGTGTFVVAYAVHKVFAPARIATTLTATPLIVRYLRQIGFLKVPQQSKPK